MLLAYMRKVMGLNTGQNTVYPDWNLLRFSRQMHSSYFKLGHDLLILNPIKFIIQ